MRALNALARRTVGQSIHFTNGLFSFDVNGVFLVDPSRCSRPLLSRSDWFCLRIDRHLVTSLLQSEIRRYERQLSSFDGPDKVGANQSRKITDSKREKLGNLSLQLAGSR